MNKRIFGFMLTVFFGALVFSGCNLDPGNNAITFSSATNPGDLVSTTVGSTSFDMILVNSSTGISFPTGTDDSGTTSLSRKFFLGETEVTNSLVAEILQWAYDNGRFSATVTDPSGLDSSTIKHGGQELLDWQSNAWCRVDYAGGVFSVESGYENHPVVNLSWYGAVILCNWLTEMTDGGTSNLVYSGIDSDWDHTETVADDTKQGFRLPSSTEIEYAARYIGTNAPAAGDDLDSEVVSTSAPGTTYYWTPGDYASGATADYNDAAATSTVAWYSQAELKAVAGKAENQLGIYDMSGNNWEWCYTVSGGTKRTVRCGGFTTDASYTRVGFALDSLPFGMFYNQGFRLARTQ